jgi:hypothetical protein
MTNFGQFEFVLCGISLEAFGAIEEIAGVIEDKEEARVETFSRSCDLYVACLSVEEVRRKE